jgi:hypothetical protein
MGDFENLSLQELLAVDRHLTRALMQMDEVEEVFNGKSVEDRPQDVFKTRDRVSEILDEVLEECERRDIPEKELELYIQPRQYTEI